MTAGSDGQSIDNMSLSRIEKLIASLKDESYQPQPSRRVYIPKKNGKMRPLGVPAFDDKLVQEVIRMVLEVIYEGHFEYTSHGFRPNRSCHTALAQIQKSFSGAKWFIEGDIKGFFDNISHDVLISILKERISDDRFIRLIRKFLNAGYIKDWKFHKTYSGTPQGGIVSPILANIYLDKLDKYMKDYIENFDKGEKRRPSRVRMDFENARKRTVRKLKSVKDESGATTEHHHRKQQGHHHSLPHAYHLQRSNIMTGRGTSAPRNGTSSRPAIPSGRSGSDASRQRTRGSLRSGTEADQVDKHSGRPEKRWQSPGSTDTRRPRSRGRNESRRHSSRLRDRRYRETRDLRWSARESRPGRWRQISRGQR